MIKSVYNYPVSTLLDIESGVVYAIPRYQREYTWSRAQWDALFDDLLENEPNYFLGSIICINQSQDALSVQSLELVDGQQRMTTLSLLLAAIYQNFRVLPNLGMEQQIELYNLKHKLVLKRKSDQPRLIPQVQNNNQQDYFAVLGKAGILDDVEQVQHAGNRRVLKAYRHFLWRIEQYLQELSEPVAGLQALLDKVNTATLVKIEVAGHSDAYTLFESLNNRGVPLTAIDLIKNKLLAVLEAKDSGSIDKHYNRWKKVIDALGDDYAVQERFFRQYYNAFKPDLKDIVSVPVATKSNLMQVYEKLIAHDAESFLQAMIRLSAHYAQIVGYRAVPEQPKLSGLLLSLDRIQGAAAYLLLMVLFERKDTLELEQEHLEQVVHFLIAFFVRRNTTDLPPTRDLTRIFMDVAETVLALKGQAVVSHIQQRLTGESASDEQFEKSLKGPIYEDNKAVCRFVLCALEESRMTLETRVDLWALKGKQYVWTIEHIFPQGENIPDTWVQMIANGDAALAEQHRQTYAHCLGNLTISGYNSALGNKSFAEKQSRLDSQGRKVGYNNGLHLNQALANETSWTVDKLKARTDLLVQEVLQKYPLTISFK
ncbi:MAG: type I restriction endonuclease [Pseudomonas sp.]|nr:type I restriction endonuclease [Pseudomonas sp.]|tara:strand:+ start:885 stop:2678 length:1794 start_codon:yes stop_codon:yes gene_type:complete